MTQTVTTAPAPQRLRALAQANEVRLARAELKRLIANGKVSAADVILACPPEAERWSIGDVLMSQHRWGTNRCRKFLARNQINEMKQIGTLTERQRRMLATQLRSHDAVSQLLPELAAQRQALPPSPQRQSFGQRREVVASAV
jgi:hypothetical protein